MVDFPAQQDRAHPDEAAGTGMVRVLVFFENEPLPGATVVVGGQELVTNDYGAVEIEVPARAQKVEVRFVAKGPEGAPVVVVGSRSVGVVSGETSEVIVSQAGPGAEMDWDVEGPSVEEAETAKEVAEATEFGRVSGHITSIEDSAPIANARVFVRGVDAEAVTEKDGRFEIQVPVGTHALSVIHPQFSTLSRPDVEVKKDETTEIEIVLTPASVRLDDFIVTAPHIQGSVAGLMDERRESSAVSDAIGREDISKMPASDAAAAAQRVVGATIVGGRFVYVRGLGERYTNALLNGGPLPSPEPDRASVPLDLFPAQILDSLDIVKTFTPDYPADFAGGSVRIVTRGVPEEFVFDVSLSAGFDTQSSFREPWAAPKGKLDWLGFDDGGRAMSSEIPSDYRLQNGATRPDGSLVTQDDANQFGPALNSQMSPRKRLFGIGTSGSLLVGNGWRVGRKSKMGVLGSLVYRHGYDSRYETRRILNFNPKEEFDATDNLEMLNEYKIRRSNESVRWGAFLTSTVEVGEEHTIALHLMQSQLGDNAALVGTGFQVNENSYYQTTRLEYASRSLTTGQLQGEHDLELLNDAKLEWRAFASYASRNQPDTRDVAFQNSLGRDDWLFKSTPASGRHFFSNQSEFARGGALDWTQPLWGGAFATKLKAGTMLNQKTRAFLGRRIAFQRARSGSFRTPPLNCGPSYSPISCSDDLFQDQNIGTELDVQDGFLVGDAYDASLGVYAGYLMADFELGEHWRLVGGARLEKTIQTVVPYDPFEDTTVDDMSTRLDALDVLPGASVSFSPIEEVAIRGALSKTLARPQLRELAPFAFTDYFGGFQTSGNPDLKLSYILNADLRFEWYPTAREVLAISVFAKKFDDPIEPIMQPTGSAPQRTFQNADGARLFGMEMEARKSLDFVAEALEDFTLIGSLMLAQSKIQIVNEAGGGYITNTNRALVNQAPWVINLSLDYENEHGTQFRVLYNVSGPQIVMAGINGLPDAYLQPRHMLDATASQRIRDHWKLKLTATNILDAEYLETQGKSESPYNVLTKYREGVNISLGASFSY